MRRWLETSVEFWREDRSLSVVLGFLILTVFVASRVGLATGAEATIRIAFPFLLLGGLAVFSRRLFVAAIMVVVLSRSLSKGEVTAHRVSGMVAAYLLCGLIFAHAFALVERLKPGSFTADSGLLDSGGGWSSFSYISKVTLGYGDLTPLHPVACSLTSFEAFVGQALSGDSHRPYCGSLDGGNEGPRPLIHLPGGMR